MPGGYCHLLHQEHLVKGACSGEQETTFAETTGRLHEAGRHRRSFPSSPSQSEMRAGDDVRRDDGATARGRAPATEFPLLSLPIRDASRRRRSPRQRGNGTRPGTIDGVSPPLAPSQGHEQETTMVVSTFKVLKTLFDEIWTIEKIKIK